MKPTQKTGTASSNPFAALDKMLKISPEPKGPDWFTAEQYAAHAGLDPASVARLMKRLCREGKVETWNGSIATRNGLRRRANKFRVVRT